MALFVYYYNILTFLVSCVSWRLIYVNLLLPFANFSSVKNVNNEGQEDEVSMLFGLFCLPNIFGGNL